MKNIYLLFYGLFCYLNVSGQDYIEYHQKIKKAEQAILDSNYISAVGIYDSVFKEFSFVFAKNCYTATQTAIVANQYDKAFLFIERCFLQGLKIDIVDDDSILVQLKSHQQWKCTVLKYDSLREIYEKKINWDLRNCINELYDLDQKWRDKHELNPGNNIWRPSIWKKWKNVTKDIVENKLLPMIIENGFPGEQLIGVDEKWMHHKKTKDSKGSNFTFTILIHYYSTPRKSNINTLLMEEIKKGNISPEHYASIIDFQAKWGKGKYYDGLYYNQWHKTNDTSLFSVINTNRQNIGLESLSVLDKKLKRGLMICKLLNEGIYKNIWLFISRCDS